MRKISYSFAILISLLVIACSNHLSPEKAIQKLGSNPYFEIDGNQVSQSDLANYKPTEIADLTTFYNKDAVKRYGTKAADGAVIIETKQFATIKFENFLKVHSMKFISVKEINFMRYNKLPIMSFFYSEIYYLFRKVFRNWVSYSWLPKLFMELENFKKKKILRVL